MLQWKRRCSGAIELLFAEISSRKVRTFSKYPPGGPVFAPGPGGLTEAWPVVGGKALRVTGPQNIGHGPFEAVDIVTCFFDYGGGFLDSRMVEVLSQKSVDDDRSRTLILLNGIKHRQAVDKGEIQVQDKEIQRLPGLQLAQHIPAVAGSPHQVAFTTELPVQEPADMGVAVGDQNVKFLIFGHIHLQ